MILLELQRQLAKDRFQIQRLVCLVVSAMTFGAALILTVQGAAVGRGDVAGHAFTLEIQEAPEEDLRLQPDEKEMELLARAVYSEARGEQFQGQVAVAAVIINRVEDSDFPNNVAGVIFQPQAFTAVADGQFWLNPDQTAYRAVEEALKGKDPSCGALYYYNPVTATSYWIFGRPTITRIGRHVFAG
jgi:spore germination cell wall hydrolase CwlJ-like protein